MLACGCPIPISSRLIWQAAKFRLQALHQYREAFLESAAPDWATKREVKLLPLGGDDKWERKEGWSEEGLAALNNTIRQQYQQRMGNMQINARARRRPARLVPPLPRTRNSDSDGHFPGGSDVPILVRTRGLKNRFRNT